MSEDYPHLALRPLAALADERQRGADTAYPHGSVDQLRTGGSRPAALEDLLTFPKRTRMPNLLLFGPTNNGKTMIVEKFRRTHPPGSEEAHGTVRSQVPVLKVQMPPAPDERRFFWAILEALGAPDRTAIDRLSSQAGYGGADDARDRRAVLVIDEVHNMLWARALQQRRLLNLLRWLGNELQIPLVAVGTAEALRAIQSDDQLANRFTPFGLPPWEGGAEFTRLLNTLEASIPLKEASNLSSPPMAQRLLSISEGILGEVVSIVTRAAVTAVATGKECILPDMLDELGFIPALRASSCPGLRRICSRSSCSTHPAGSRRSGNDRGCRAWSHRCRDEALASWLLRYAEPFEVSPEDLLLPRAEMELAGPSDWWRRPHPTLLEHLAQATGIDAVALADLTLRPGDEDTDDPRDRFAGVRFRAPGTASRHKRRIAVCPHCLRTIRCPMFVGTGRPAGP